MKQRLRLFMVSGKVSLLVDVISGTDRAGRTVLLLLIVFIAGYAEDSQGQDRQEARIEMVEAHIEGRDVTNPQVLDAMRTVRRHLFVPEEHRTRAYENRPLPIGYGQTISQPYIVAYMTEQIEPDSSDRVLEIGTGSGYQAAVLAEVVNTVKSVEIIEPLANTAATRLESLNYENVDVRRDDGYYGWEEHAPYDAIVVTAAAEHIPPPLVEQLKNGGRMVIPVGNPYFTQTLMLVRKQDGETTTRNLIPVQFVPLTREEQ